MALAKIVYCIDKTHPLYGKRLRVDYAAGNTKPIFNDMQTGKQVALTLEQVSETPPPKQ